MHKSLNAFGCTTSLDTSPILRLPVQHKQWKTELISPCFILIYSSACMLCVLRLGKCNAEGSCCYRVRQADTRLMRPPILKQRILFRAMDITKGCTVSSATKLDPIVGSNDFQSSTRVLRQTWRKSLMQCKFRIYSLNAMHPELLTTKNAERCSLDC